MNKTVLAGVLVAAFMACAEEGCAQERNIPEGNKIETPHSQDSTTYKVITHDGWTIFDTRPKEVREAEIKKTFDRLKEQGVGISTGSFELETGAPSQADRAIPSKPFEGDSSKHTGQYNSQGTYVGFERKTVPQDTIPENNP